MFSQNDFDVFLESTLIGRMEKIQNVIDPQFEQLAKKLLPYFEQNKITIYPHIAKHLRRTVNPPINTWIAFGPAKRGYKKNPHIEVGFWKDRLFVWLALLGESKADQQNGQRLQASQNLLFKLTNDYYVCKNHTDTQIESATNNSISQMIRDYQEIKKDEFLVGRVWFSGDPFFKENDEEQTKVIEAALDDLLPIYQEWL
ncbi:hypothetical protein LOOC260_115660 [Paucilactobacillus hokkaidonensis JCM 18461]|uniref:Uncharacterized protein n=2 Tax=Paucilactobacillus hokkaidonensis TaxID=1193095 RepID=A0A0A1H025_9LACO|nr:DUF1054 family protein [Paucilactobacillus hokkaidonensis]KRO10556.1 hypothetical protein IV59_GL001654 [Paucilactobacillus hokkaidonensis]BAP86076.1 hypothetical protein LOOC260_115660 [Paucilactobacillus hokkaidonensis JCM 18461]